MPVVPVVCASQAEVEIETVITGRYTIEWNVAGDTTVDLLHYALPHHQVSLRAPLSLYTSDVLG